MEVACDAKVVLIHMRCDKCGIGLMEKKNILLTSKPMKYIHVCNKCGNEELYKVSYPYQKIIPIEHLRQLIENEKE